MLYCTQYNQAYHDYIVRCDALDAKIEIKQKQQGRLSAQIAQLKKQKRGASQAGAPRFLRPLAKDLEAYLDKPVNVAGPFGLRAEVLLRVFDNPETQAPSAYRSLTIVPDFSRGTLELHYDTGRVVRECPPGSIGALNHIGNETLPLPDTLSEIALLLHAANP